MCRFFIKLFLIASLLSGCSSKLIAPDENDPLEDVNRGIFWFNDKVDIYVLEPVATGYDYVIPNPVQRGISNFFNNLETPVRLVSDIIQFKFEQASIHLARFAINTTAGLAGFIDVAKTQGLEPHYEDLSTALAYHGVPEGPFIVIPFLGPSSLRHLVGRVGDNFVHPRSYLGLYFSDEVHDDTAAAISYGLTGLELINTRASLLEAIETAKDSSLDYYAFVRAAYFQNRRSLVNDGETPEEEPFDEDEFDDEEFEDEQP